MSDKSDFDLVLFGATGFTGQLLAEYLLKRHGVEGDLRWVLAGRSLDKLETVRSKLGKSAAGLDLLTADSHDRASLDALVTRTRAVCSTVGPYALHGSDLVAAEAPSRNQRGADIRGRGVSYQDCPEPVANQEDPAHLE